MIVRNERHLAAFDDTTLVSKYLTELDRTLLCSTNTKSPASPRIDTQTLMYTDYPAYQARPKVGN